MMKLIGTAMFWRMAFIVLGWALCALFVGLTVLVAIGVIEAPQSASPWWLAPIKGAIWPVLGHSIAGWIEQRSARKSA